MQVNFSFFRDAFASHPLENSEQNLKGLAAFASNPSLISKENIELT
jgi:hypothetical protein